MARARGSVLLNAVSQRRLSAIVAIDLAGYSSRTEDDEAAAVRAVTALSDLIEAKAAEHGGRVFNTAGDGFMLEFGTVSGALAAAGEIAAAADPPVRVGVHLGEVSVGRGEDLLGHGVNVAARLQALARPGSVLASEAVKRAAQGPETKRLRPQGVVRLDKMSERVTVYALEIEGARGGMAPRLSRHWPVLAVLVAVIIVAAGVWFARGLFTPDLTVAVAPLQAQAGDDASRSLAAGLPTQIVSALTDRQIATVSPDAASKPRRGGARLLVDGHVERSGDRLRLRVSLNDLRADRVLWTTTLDRSAVDGDALGEQAAAKIADVVYAATSALGPNAGHISADTLAAFLNLPDQSRDGTDVAEAAIAGDRRIIALAPNFAKAHSKLAVDLAMSSYQLSGPVADKIRDESRAEAEKALSLDPHSGDAYVARFMLIPHGDIAAHEAMLIEGLQVAPQNAPLNNFLSDLLRAAGRLRDAEPYYQRAMRLDPLSPPKTATVIFALAGDGREGEAEVLADHALRLFPNTASIRRAALYTAVLYGTPERALQALEKVNRIAPMNPTETQLWKAYIEAGRNGRYPPALLRDLEAGARAGEIDPSTTMSALSKAGAVDAAFAVANDAIDRGVNFYMGNLYERAAANMRRDPRIIALAARPGFGQYWKTTGKWPDFCADPGLPYDCKAVAAKL